MHHGLQLDITMRKQADKALHQDSDKPETRTGERTRERADGIAERKGEEVERRENDERFRHAFEFAPIGMALITPEGNRFKINRALADFLGYTIEELDNTSMESTNADPEQLEISMKLRQQVIDGELTTYKNRRSFRKKTDKSFGVT